MKTKLLFAVLALTILAGCTSMQPKPKTDAEQEAEIKANMELIDQKFKAIDEKIAHIKQLQAEIDAMPPIK